MRVSYAGLTALALCAGCAARGERVVSEPQSKPIASVGRVKATAPIAADPVEQPQGAPVAPQAPVERQTPVALQTPTVSPQVSSTPPPQQTLTADETRALVDTLVAEAIASKEQDLSAAGVARTEKLAAEARAAAQAAAEAAEIAAQDETRREAALATSAARQDDELLARFLLLPDELDRVERIKEKLKTENIWGLTRQDLDFAAAGFAAPLLHDALHEAAGRYDADIELDVVAHKAQLTPEEKVQLATMPPVERQRLLTFTDQFANGKPSVEADRYIREYINRYPIMRKILLAHLRTAPDSP